MKRFLYYVGAVAVVLLTSCQPKQQPIDRQAVVSRHNPQVTSFDTLASLSVGNGDFCFTVDATGLQTFPRQYEMGVPLGTFAGWGWHSFVNTENYMHNETLKDYTFHTHKAPYAVEFKEEGRQREAATYYRVNPHLMHLGNLGFVMRRNGQDAQMEDIAGISQTLDLWRGVVKSQFQIWGATTEVETACSPTDDVVAAVVRSPLLSLGNMSLRLSLPYPTGKHSDVACDWNRAEAHTSKIVRSTSAYALIEHVLDTTVYYVALSWVGHADIKASEEPHCYDIVPHEGTQEMEIACQFVRDSTMARDFRALDILQQSQVATAARWQEGAAVDFSGCTDERAKELERRVVLSQYLTSIQNAGTVPPQEAGLTYNTWFGRPHLEMYWWHSLHFSLWGRSDVLKRSLDWYKKAYPKAREIAARQGYKGVRWMKMTDPWAGEAPSKVGSFLIWQQPHFIYLAEELYRANPSPDILNEYYEYVAATADFMASFAQYDSIADRYILSGIIPAQETLPASETINPPFELSYWHYGLSKAIQWNERLGKPVKEEWKVVLDKLSPLASKDGLYLAAESAPQSYTELKFHSDHMAVLGAWGMLPFADGLYDKQTMKTTLDWIINNWNWNKTWGWDYPMTAMNAVRQGQTDVALDILLIDKRTNTYLVNGHNYQDGRLRVYLPGNGGLLTTVAMMCAGWDGCQDENNPGFPKDGTWNVRWEGFKPMQ